MVNILNAVCSDYALARVLQITKTVIGVLGIVVPILLIIGGTINFFKASLNPEDKQIMKRFTNSVASAIIVFLLPFIINVIMSVISTYSDVGIREGKENVAFNISTCWIYSDFAENSLENETEENILESIADEAEKLNK